MSNIFETELIPIKKLYESDSYRIYSAEPVNPKNHPFTLNSYGNFIIKGKFQSLQEEVVYKAKVKEVYDKQKRLAYEVEEIYREIPKSKDAQKEFLLSILTELQVSEIYKAYPDEDIIELFKNDTFDYKKVKGIGEHTYQYIRKKILDNIEWQMMFVELGKYGIKFETMMKLRELFGSSENVIQKVKENPYVLTLISGIGFKKADKIAKSIGIANDSSFRIQAAIRHVINEEEQSGHTYTKLKQLLSNCSELLEIEEELIKEQINQTEGLHIEDDRIALKKTYLAEKEVAKILINKLNNSNQIEFDLEPFFKEQEQILGINLTDKQKEFFYNFLKYNIVFLIGAAGCGKSQLQVILLRLIKLLRKNNINDSVSVIPLADNISNEIYINNNKSEPQNSYLKYTYKLLAPTGRAAKVLSQYVEGESAYTIHKAIGYGRKNKEVEKEDIGAKIELSEDIIVTDESGMVDIKLELAKLKKITNENTRLVFIGDSAQIPSVGAGNFLKNCVDSNVFPVTVLDQVFRQKEGGILDIATKTRKGEKFIDSNFFGEKLFGKDMLLHSVKQEYMKNGVIYYYKKLLEKYNPEDIMVLTYTKKGELGTQAINKQIQNIVNPPSPEKKERNYGEDIVFRVGDYVMNTENTYEILDIHGNPLDVMNGESGKIIDIVTEKDIEDIIKNEKYDKELGYNHLIGMYVQFDENIVAIPFEMLGNLIHSWALTIHKSQGGNCKAGILIIDKSHKFNLNANIIYTGITRCKEQLIILCQAESLNFALRKFENMSRRTFLEELLREEYRSTVIT